MDEKALNSIFRAQLHARMINYDLYFFESGSACVIIKVKSTKLSIQIPYIISCDGDTFTVSTPDMVSVGHNNESSAVSIIVRDVRQQEVKFNKFSK